MISGGLGGKKPSQNLVVGFDPGKSVVFEFEETCRARMKVVATST